MRVIEHGDERFECPNGHQISGDFFVECDECDEAVHYVPVVVEERLAEQLRGAVHFTDEERERVLWWLRRPVHPGPMKDLDEQIIRKLNGGDR